MTLIQFNNIKICFNQILFRPSAFNSFGFGDFVIHNIEQTINLCKVSELKKQQTNCAQFCAEYFR